MKQIFYTLNGLATCRTINSLLRVTLSAWLISLPLLLSAQSAAEGGALSLDDEQNAVSLCVTAPATALSLNNTGSGDAYVYLLTDADNILEAVLDNTTVDPATYSPGAYRIHGLAYSGSLTATPGAEVTSVSLSDGDYDLSDNFINLHILPAPVLETELIIAGVDFPASGTCGHFNVILEATFRNTGPVDLSDLSGRLDLDAVDAFGGAFVNPVDAPVIVEGTAGGEDLNEQYDGIVNTELFQSGVALGRSESVKLRLSLEIAPEGAADPAVLQALLESEAAGDYSGYASGSVPAPPASCTVNAGASAPLGDCWLKSKQLAANNQVNLTVNAACEAFFTPDEFIENHFPGCDASNYPLGGYYRVFFQGKEITGPVDLSQYVGQKLVYQVKSVAHECLAVWGYVLTEDKSGPTVNCPNDVRGLIKYKDDAETKFRAAEGPEAATSGKIFNFLTCTEIDSVYEADRSWKDQRYKYYTGFPQASDACGQAFPTEVIDELDELGCEEYLRVNGRQVAAILSRTFVFRDQFDNRDSCTQQIYFFRPYLFLPECKLELDQCVYSSDSLDLLPEAIGSAPFFVTGGCDTLLLTDHVCDFTVSYEDQYFQAPENCGQKIIRIWSILDWCWRNTDYINQIGRSEGYADCPGFPDFLGKKVQYEQHIIIGDTQAPVVYCPGADAVDSQPDELVFSAGPFDCNGTIAPPAPIVEGECEAWTWTFELYGDVYDPKILLTTYEYIGTAGDDHMLSGVPTGEYDLFYIVTDACGNTTRIANPCPVVVRDAVNPVAVCNDELNISIGGENYANVPAADIDEGSWDNCGPVELHARRTIEDDCVDSYLQQIEQEPALTNLIAVQRADIGNTALLEEYPAAMIFYFTAAPDRGGRLALLLEQDGFFYSTWAASAYFTCCDISTDTTDKVNVELRVTDRGGNQNKCWMRVLVEDKIPPRCRVKNTSILCTEIDFDPADQLQVAARFGEAEEVVEVIDNCGATISEEQVFQSDNCGTGVIERRFTVTDGSGLSSGCTQRITLEEVNDYTIRFPGDIDIDECGAAPEADILAESFACDILAVSRDTARFDASGDECFKRFVTFSVINWCEYDGESVQPTEIPRDIDQDGDFAEDTWLEAGLDPDFVATYLPGETEPLIVKIFAADDQGAQQALPEQVLVHRECADGSFLVGYRSYRHLGGGNYELFCEKDAAAICVDKLYDQQCWTPGFYEYTQLIKVYDTEAPFLELLTNELEFCAYGSPAEDCGGQVFVPFQLGDDCTPADTELRNIRLLVDRDPANVLTLDDGVFNLTEEDGILLLSGKLPVGTHRFLLQATDGCGNLAGLSIDFSVVDCKSPAPICINGLAIELMPVDTNDDGSVDTGMNTIWATDYIASPIDDCAGEVTYSINWVGEIPDSTQTALTVTCDDPLYQALPVEVHAWDKEGNHDYCETFIVVEDLREICDLPVTGSIAGLIRTEAAQPVEHVRVQLSGGVSRFVHTGNDGLYHFAGLEQGYDYSVQTELDEDPLNGVTTFDLILISKHILGVKRIDSPYRLIAADANRSNSVTTLDLIQLRKLILGVAPDLSNNTSWRFVPAHHQFADSQNPWSELNQESGNSILSINNLSGDVSMADLIGIKVGDVNGNARPNTWQSVEERQTTGALTLHTSNVLLQKGERYTVAFGADDLSSVAGFQFTLQFDQALVELIDMQYGIAQAHHFGVFPAEGLITSSWNTGGQVEAAENTALPGQVETGGQLFTLVFRAKSTVQLKEALNIGSRLTPAEAYTTDGELMDVELDFDQGGTSSGVFQLYQNRPNPFTQETQIGFELPAAGEVVLNIHDVNGRLIQTIAGDYAKGYNEIRLDRQQLPAGVLYYTLKTTQHTATRKMILVK